MNADQEHVQEPSSVSSAVPPVHPVPEQRTVPGKPARRAAAPSAGRKPKRFPKKPKRRLPRTEHQVLAKHAATFCDMLRKDPALQALIRSNPRSFRADLQALIRAEFPLRRGRPPDPQLDEAYRMVTEQGKSVSQVARKQFQGWDRRDPYEQYLILRGLRQAVNRRKPRPYKRNRRRKPENRDQSRTKKQH